MAGTMKFQGRIFPILYSCFIGFGMLLCLILSMMYHWDKVTKNHCKVWEFWPSVSSAIGDFKPEKNYWRVAIALGAGPRFITGILNYKMLNDALSASSSSTPFKHKMVTIAFIVDVVRIFAAGGWTYVSSSEYLFFHEVSFVIYVVGSFVWALIHTPLFYATKVKYNTDHNSSNYRNALFSYRVKWGLIALQIVMFSVSMYWFLIAHRLHCAPGAYSIYSICEWIMSAANILFDASCALDFDGYAFTLSGDNDNSNNNTNTDNKNGESAPKKLR